MTGEDICPECKHYDGLDKQKHGWCCLHAIDSKDKEGFLLHGTVETGVVHCSEFDKVKP